MKLGIKSKILIATSIVVTGSLFLSGTIANYYFQKIFKERAIRDDLTKLNQTAQHLNYQIDDLKKMGTSIIINEEMQTFVNRTQYQSYYERLAQARKELNFLANQIMLRNFIHSATVVTSDGSVWYTDLRTTPHDYFQSKLSEPWYQNYLQKKEQFYFSTPHLISNVTRGTSTERVISFIVQFRNIDQPDQVKGQLLLNIALHHFEKNMVINSVDYDAFYWVNQEGEVIYDRNPISSGLSYQEVQPYFTALETESSKVIENAKGYLIVNNTLDNGWKLISFTSNQRLFHRIRFIRYFFLCTTFISLALIILVVLPLILKFTKPVTEITQAMKQVASGDLNVALKIRSGDELETMADSFNRMVVDLKQHIAESVEYEKSKRKLEFDVLLSQINPHFIYNILNTIIYLARKRKQYDIVNLVDSFIRILQDGIKVAGEGLLTSIQQEIEIVNHYVQIQQYRYRDRFNLIWKTDPALLGCLIPKTLIQPLVENALFHGICPKEGEKGNIWVSVFTAQNALIIEVRDDGVGMKPEMVVQLLQGGQIYQPESKLRSIGIVNIQDRIRYMYGDDYGVTIQSVVRSGTTITVTLPIQRENKT